MYLSKYKKYNLLIWVFSYETQQAPRFRGNFFCHAQFWSYLVLVTPSFGHTPVLRAACYGQNAVLQPYDLPVTRGASVQNPAK